MHHDRHAICQRARAERLCSRMPYSLRHRPAVGSPAAVDSSAPYAARPTAGRVSESRIRIQPLDTAPRSGASRREARARRARERRRTAPQDLARSAAEISSLLPRSGSSGQV